MHNSMNKVHVKSIVISDKIYMKKEDVEDIELLTKLFSYPGVDEELTTLEENETHYMVPSNGYYKLTWDNVIDNRTFEELTYDLNFTGTLRPEQEESVAKFLTKGRAISGIFQAECGYGKTFAGCAIVARNNTRALILVHTKLLFRQWIEELEKLLDNTKIGKIGDGLFQLEDVTVAIYKSAFNNIDKIKDEFSLAVIDECLDYEAAVQDDKGNKIKIGKVVNNKMPINILCYNENLQCFEYKKIYNWFKNKHDNMLYIQTHNNATLRCTSNHIVYKYEQGKIVKVSADTLKIGDFLISNNKNKVSKLLKKEVLPILLGLILGEGSLENTRGKKTTRVKITHGYKQQEYLEYKTKILKDFFVGNTIKGTSGYKPENTVYSNQSVSFIDNLGLISKLYGDKRSKSTIDNSLFSYINEFTWALLHQDDGSYVNGQITFSVCELDEKSCELLIKSLKSLFKLKDPYFFTCNRGFKYIRLKTNDSTIFLQKINKYIHPTMAYKTCNYRPENFIPIEVDNIYENFTLKEIKKISSRPATNGYRYNISVEDNHNYIAGGVLVGNCHKSPANMFSTVVNNLSAKVKIGISATPKRKDGKHVFLYDYFSPFHVVAKDARTLLNPSIKIIDTDFKFNVIQPKRDWARQINKLASNKNYINLIANHAIADINNNRCILILSDRLGMLKDLEKLIPNSILLVGATKNEVREDILKNAGKTYKVILTTRIFDEGISCHRLDTMYTTCPSNNPNLLEQRIGRIIREHPDKEAPLVKDFWLKGHIVARQQMSRKLWYGKRGYNIL